MAKTNIADECEGTYADGTACDNCARCFRERRDMRAKPQPVTKPKPKAKPLPKVAPMSKPVAVKVTGEPIGDQLQKLFSEWGKLEGVFVQGGVIKANFEGDILLSFVPIAEGASNE